MPRPSRDSGGRQRAASVAMPPMEVGDRGPWPSSPTRAAAASASGSPKRAQGLRRHREPGDSPCGSSSTPGTSRRLCRFYAPIFAGTTSPSGDTADFRYTVPQGERPDRRSDGRRRTSCPTTRRPTGRSTSRSRTSPRRWPGQPISAGARRSVPGEDTPYGRWPPPSTPPAPSSSSAPRRSRPTPGPRADTPADPRQGRVRR